MLVDRTMNATAAEKDGEAQQDQDEEEGLEGTKKAVVAGAKDTG